MNTHTKTMSHRPRIAWMSTLVLLTACAGRPSLPDPLEAAAAAARGAL